MAARRKLSADGRRALGGNLVAEREKAQLSQGAAAGRIGITAPRLAIWESASGPTPELDGLVRLAALYKCPIDNFLGGVYDPYDTIIEQRLPIDAKRFYQAKHEALKALTLRAMDLTVSALAAPAPTPTARAANRAATSGKSKPARARQGRKQTPKRGK
jgi:transcriptional regulator with XRE-family HTH domain